MNITNQTSTLLDMLNSSSSSSKTSKSDSYVDILIQNNNLRYQQRMKEVLGTNVGSSSKDAEYEKTAGAAADIKVLHIRQDYNVLFYINRVKKGWII